MTIYLLDHRIAFPDPRRTDGSGILAIGGDLSPNRLLLAYSLGIFPWFAHDDPILWHCPKERAVLNLGELHVSRTMNKVMRRKKFDVRFDTAFTQVMEACAQTPRLGQDGTWITKDMISAYSQLHQMGYAHCAESWLEGQLVGGVYGVTLGRIFFGESMFSHQANASKVAFISLVHELAALGYQLIDAQVYNEFLGTLGVRIISRAQFLRLLSALLSEKPTRVWP